VNTSYKANASKPREQPKTGKMSKNETASKAHISWE
jgi:hypothetical protein